MTRDSKTQNPVNCNACHPEERSDDKVPGELCQGKDLVPTRILRPVGPQNDKLLSMPFTVHVVDLLNFLMPDVCLLLPGFFESRVTSYASRFTNKPDLSPCDRHDRFYFPEFFLRDPVDVPVKDDKVGGHSRLY